MVELPSILKSEDLKIDLQDKWLERCKKGDRKAQYELYKQFVKPLYHAVIRLVPSKPEAEDIVQDAFISIFKNITQYRSESSLYTWMRRIAVNKALDEIRKKKIQWIIEYKDVEPDLFEIPEEEPADEMLINHLHGEIKRLPDGCREILTLFLFEGFKHSEIADKLNISESTSKTQYARAKKLLAAALVKNRIE